MSACLLNRESYDLPDDGWYQIAPLGDFAHSAAGVVQVVDATACERMTAQFRDEAQRPHFAGLLIDFDHFSLDTAAKSEAAGWIVALEARVPKGTFEVGGSKFEVGNDVSDAEAGLWAKIRWSDVGEQAVRGGRYRFLSPVWARTDCEDLGDGRLRPVRLLNAAVTNDPNLKGMVPLSNRGEREEVRGQDALLKNAEGDTRFKWTLGPSPDDRHCPTCLALAGQVHTMAEWNAAGIAPRDSGLYCQGHCHCELVETDEPASGDLTAVPVRTPDPVSNRESGHLQNTGWTDEAREASLAVRRAKAAKRKETESASDSGSESEGQEVVELDEIREKLRDGVPLTAKEKKHLDDLMEDGYAGESDSDPVFEWMERRSNEEMDAEEEEAERTRQVVHEHADALRDRKAQGDKLSPEETKFLIRYDEVFGNRIPRDLNAPGKARIRAAKAPYSDLEELVEREKRRVRSALVG